MRTRTLNNVYLPFIGQQTAHNYERFTYYWGYNITDNDLNKRTLALSQEPYYYNTQSPVLFGTSSTMSDELVFRKRVGKVDHVKRDVAIPVPVTYVTETIGGILNRNRIRYYDLPPLFRVNALRKTVVGTRPYYDIWYRINTWNPIYNPHKANISSLPPSIEPDIPALTKKIMGKLDSFNGATYFLELREFPELVKWSRRQAIVAGAVLKNRKALVELGSQLRRIIRRHYGAKSFAQLSVNAQVDCISRFIMREFRNTYLGVIFGLSPTVGESIQLYKEAEKGYSKKSTFTATVRDSQQSTVVGNLGNQGITANIRIIASNSSNSVYGARVEHVFSPYSSKAMQDTNLRIASLMGHNPAQPLWAVFPFSFVVDWFLGVDNVLDAIYLNQTSNLKIEWWRSYKLERSISATGDILSGYFYSDAYQSSSAKATPQYTTVNTNGQFSRYIREPIPQPSGTYAIRLPTGLSKGKIFTLALIALGLIDNQ